MGFEDPFSYQNRAVAAGFPPRYGAQILFWTHAQLRERDRLLEEPVEGAVAAAVDAAFFLLALNNVRRSCVWTAQAVSDAVITSAIGAYDSEVPAAKNVRDILEHFDRYLDGTGNLQVGTKRIPAGTLDYPYVITRTVGVDDTRHERYYELRIDGHHVEVGHASNACAALATSVMAALEARLSTK